MKLLDSLVRVRDGGFGRRQAAVLELETHAELDGRMGTPHFGMHGDPAVTYTGWVASPQRFQGQAQMGKSRRVSVQQYPALPNTEPPPAQATWLQDWTALEGLQ